MYTFREFLIREARTKVPCRRCGGTGQFSYNLLHGSMCYGCMGRKYQMVDLDKERTRQASAEQRRAAREQYQKEVAAVTDAFGAEVMQQQHWSYDLRTALGWDQLNKAYAGVYHQSFWLVRDARLRQLGIQKP